MRSPMPTLPYRSYQDERVFRRADAVGAFVFPLSAFLLSYFSLITFACPLPLHICSYGKPATKDPNGKGFARKSTVLRFSSSLRSRLCFSFRFPSTQASNRNPTRRPSPASSAFTLHLFPLCGSLSRSSSRVRIQTIPKAAACLDRVAVLQFEIFEREVSGYLPRWPLAFLRHNCRRSRRWVRRTPIFFFFSNSFFLLRVDLLGALLTLFSLAQGTGEPISRRTTALVESLFPFSSPSAPSPTFPCWTELCP